MLYTIMPYEIIFTPNMHTVSEFEELLFMGEIIEAKLISTNKYVINRLISSSPKAYLNPMFAPGTVVSSQGLCNVRY